jgi:hypothetical protein
MNSLFNYKLTSTFSTAERKHKQDTKNVSKDNTAKMIESDSLI